MQFHTIKRKTKNKKSRQVGRGGTRGKTAGRGTKGQNARAGRKKRPEMRDFIKRIPKLRGRGVSPLKSRVLDNVAINLTELDLLVKAGETVDAKFLSSKGVLNTGRKAKILGKGDISKSIILKGVDASATAREKIEKAGGKVE